MEQKKKTKYKETKSKKTEQTDSKTKTKRIKYFHDIHLGFSLPQKNKDISLILDP